MSEKQTNRENEEKKQPQEKKPDTDTLSARSALLDFYGDRSVSFASFFIASIFGLVATLAIVQQLEEVSLLTLSSVLFFIFSYVGYLTFKRFAFYADISERLYQSVKKSANLKEVSAKPSKNGDKESPKMDKYLKDTVQEQNQMFGKRFLMLEKPLKAEEGNPLVKAGAFTLGYGFLVIISVILAYLRLSSTFVFFSSFSFSLVILHDELKGLKGKQSEYLRRLILLGCLVMYAIACCYALQLTRFIFLIILGSIFVCIFLYLDYYKRKEKAIAWLSKWLPELLLIIGIVMFSILLLILENSQYSYRNYLENLNYDKIRDLVNLVVTTDGFIIAFTGVIASMILRHVLEKETEEKKVGYSLLVGEKRAEHVQTNYYREKRQTVIKFVLLILLALAISIGFSLGVITTQYFFYAIFSIIGLFIGLIELIGLVYYSLR